MLRAADWVGRAWGRTLRGLDTTLPQVENVRVHGRATHLVGSALALVLAGPGTDGGADEKDSVVQRSPEVSGGHHDTSPPLRDLPPAERKPGHRVHEVKMLPRPRPGPQADPPRESPGREQQNQTKEPVPPRP